MKYPLVTNYISLFFFLSLCLILSMTSDSPKTVFSLEYTKIVPQKENQSAVKTVYLDELELEFTKCGWQKTLARQKITGGPLSVAGKKYERGVGHHAPGHLVIALPAGHVHFTAEVGLDDDSGPTGELEFLAYADGKLLWRSGFMKCGEVKHIELDLTGQKYLVLRLDEGQRYDHDHADWCDAKFVWTPSSDTTIEVPKTPKIIPCLVMPDGNVVDRSDEVNLEFYAIQNQISTDNEKIRSDYFKMADKTGYNGSLHLMKNPCTEKINEQAVHSASTILPTDRDPLDVLIRRTRTLCNYLQENTENDTLQKESASLTALEKETAQTPVDRISDRKKIFRDTFNLRRTIALANPLLDFSDILFIKRHPCDPDEEKGNHMCDQFFGFQALPGGGLFLLKNAFGNKPTVVDLLKNLQVIKGKSTGQKLDRNWGFLSPELSYNADEIFFAATDTRSPRHKFEWSEESCYHIFKVKFDAKTGSTSDLVQVTEGAFNDFDPCVLPSGRIVFISERRGGYGRCHPRIVPSYTLYSMEKSGTDIVELSAHETNEWQPVVDNNGMVVYTRWDYVDRGANNAHHPWITTPDGRDPRAITGNYNASAFYRPVLEGNLRPVPDSGLLTATAAAHHGQGYGSLLLIDPRLKDDNAMGPVRRITPEQLFPESEVPQHAAPAQYATCYPLSEYFYLCVYDPMARGDSAPKQNNYGLYLLDAFGNRTLLYRDPEIACYDPIPVRERETPPIIPHKTLVGRPTSLGETPESTDKESLPKTALMSLVNIYDTSLPFPEGTRITRLRIVQLLPKTTWKESDPIIGYGHQKGARQVLGTVPVDPDGSAYFKVPVNVPIYFQALDENGVAVQSMRSDTYVHEGELLACQGCHENRHTAAVQEVQRKSTAFRRPPSELKPDPQGTKPMNFPLLIQPILDEKCVKCHAESDNPKAIDLSRGPEKNHFFNSFVNLKSFCFFFNHYLWTESQTVPGQFGSMASPLYKILTSNHYDVKLTPEELYRFTVWMDNNCDFYGVYENCPAQKEGKIVPPTLE